MDVFQRGSITYQFIFIFQTLIKLLKTTEPKNCQLVTNSNLFGYLSIKKKNYLSYLITILKRSLQMLNIQEVLDGPVLS